MKATSKTLGVSVLMLAAALGLTGTSVGAGARQTATKRVTVTFTDRSFRVTPGVLESGATTFVVRNTGKKSHVLAISGPGVTSARTKALAAGKTAMLTVRLRAGSYMLADPVGLGPYTAQYVNVIRATSLSASGNANTVIPTVTLPAMCGGSYNP